jgi:hypothetical protein
MSRRYYTDEVKHSNQKTEIPSQNHHLDNEDSGNAYDVVQVAVSNAWVAHFSPKKIYSGNVGERNGIYLDLPFSAIEVQSQHFLKSYQWYQKERVKVDAGGSRSIWVRYQTTKYFFENQKAEIDEVSRIKLDRKPDEVKETDLLDCQLLAKIKTKLVGDLSYKSLIISNGTVGLQSMERDSKAARKYFYGSFIDKLSSVVASEWEATTEPFLLSDVVEEKKDQYRAAGIKLEYFHVDKFRVSVIYAQMHRLALKNKDKKCLFIVSDAQHERAHDLAEFFGKNSHIIPNGVDLQFQFEKRVEVGQDPEFFKIKTIEGKGLIDKYYDDTVVEYLDASYDLKIEFQESEASEKKQQIVQQIYCQAAVTFHLAQLDIRYHEHFGKHISPENRGLIFDFLIKAKRIGYEVNPDLIKDIFKNIQSLGSDYFLLMQNLLTLKKAKFSCSTIQFFRQQKLTQKFCKNFASLSETQQKFILILIYHDFNYVNDLVENIHDPQILKVKKFPTYDDKLLFHVIYAIMKLRKRLNEEVYFSLFNRDRRCLNTEFCIVLRYWHSIKFPLTMQQLLLLQSDKLLAKGFAVYIGAGILEYHFSKKIINFKRDEESISKLFRQKNIPCALKLLRELWSKSRGCKITKINSKQWEEFLKYSNIIQENSILSEILAWFAESRAASDSKLIMNYDIFKQIVLISTDIAKKRTLIMSPQLYLQIYFLAVIKDVQQVDNNALQQSLQQAEALFEQNAHPREYLPLFKEIDTLQSPDLANNMQAIFDQFFPDANVEDDQGQEPSRLRGKHVSNFARTKTHSGENSNSVTAISVFSHNTGEAGKVDRFPAAGAVHRPS